MIDLALEDHVATVTLNDPARRNAMTPELGEGLRAVVERLRRDRAVRVVILRGAGGVFSGGGDLKMLERLRTVGRDEARSFMLEFYRRYLSILDLEVPTIAAVEGAAIGAGLCVAMACDLCIVDEDAKLALNFVQLGLHPGMGATYLTPRRASAQVAAELLFTGRRFDGREAARLGLSLRAVPSASVFDEARALARTIAANGPLAIAGLVATMRVDRSALDRALEHEAEQQAISYASADLGEGLAAATARRTAIFTGS
jgi:enoyl-CoA hydratase/carnithine racemase